MEELKVYTVKEVSNILQLKSITIRKYLKEGKLNGAKIGRDWRISKEDLDLFYKESGGVGLQKPKIRKKQS